MSRPHLASPLFSAPCSPLAAQPWGRLGTAGLRAFRRRIVLLSATSAPAADASLKDTGDTAAPAYAWNGFYVGGHIGYAWGASNYTISPTPASLPETPPARSIFRKDSIAGTRAEAGLKGFRPATIIRSQTASCLAWRPMAAFQPIKTSQESPSAALPIFHRPRSAPAAIAIH